ncbi:MAG: amino acid carrier protein [Ruminococcus sp.]|uniref:alanine/glycine:cation symporter family protein n=1 Tax=Ruminococcus sp. TaxID=41978 RepID=UPI0025E1D479|nr:amino acid carrier protein [Ruminococcus sp.]MCR5601859.1 amino acid carrier protein [Ruminococcus sp.]
MLDRINGFVWGNGLVFLLIFTGLLYTVKLKGIQIKMFPYIIKRISKGNIRSEHIRTVCMSLGTAMGTGNIIGVASAISIGGAGAVFWMWISAFSGMATVYAENILSAKYSSKNCKGPMAYISKGIGSRKAAVFFAVCCILASFGMGGMTQTNTMSESIMCCTHISRQMLAIIIFIAVFAVISGGAARIGKAAQLLLPAATVTYSVICLLLIFRNRNVLPTVISKIFHEAFGFEQALGGFCGHTISRAMSAGIRRGVFSNEAGLGSSPILHSSSEASHTYGICAMFEVFTDTVICCTITALTVLCCSSDLTIRSAFLPLTGQNTDILLAGIMTVFAFCTVIGWYYCGETAFRYLFPETSAAKYAFIFSSAASVGALFRADTIWTLSDIFNGMMAFTNILALIMLSKKVTRGIKTSDIANK